MIPCSRAVSLLHQIHNIRSQVRIHVNIIDHLGQWGRLGALFGASGMGQMMICH